MLRRPASAFVVLLALVITGRWSGIAEVASKGGGAKPPATKDGAEQQAQAAKQGPNNAAGPGDPLAKEGNITPAIVKFTPA